MGSNRNNLLLLALTLHNNFYRVQVYNIMAQPYNNNLRWCVITQWLYPKFLLVPVSTVYHDNLKQLCMLKECRLKSVSKHIGSLSVFCSGQPKGTGLASWNRMTQGECVGLNTSYAMLLSGIPWNMPREKNTSDKWHIPRYPTRQHCITTLSHA